MTRKKAAQANNTSYIILNTNGITFKACLDSGNTLKFPVISLKLLEKLKNTGQIPKLLKLRRTNVKVTSADAKKIRVEGILKYPLSFSDHDK